MSVIYSINFPQDELSYDVTGGRKFQAFTYPAGESQVRILQTEIKKIIDAKEIHVTAEVANGDSLIQLALLTDALAAINAEARYVLILPYLPYGRADRRFVDGDCFGLRVFGILINAMAYDLVVTFDAHSNKAKRHISNLLDISPVQTIKDLMEQLKTQHKSYPAIILPDKGAEERLGELAQQYKTYTCTKIRNAETGKLSGFNVPKIKEPYALIVDDICDGGGTFMGIAGAIPYKTKLYLFVSHGIFSQGQEKFFPYFEGVFTTDSFVPKIDDGDVTTLPIGGTICKAILGSTARIFEEATK